ncbi:MAG: hypothetical protein HYU67_03165 [Flavobacteriia bacterium]|nr:hypothetical protein [Flavobacteriia bacterium]
MKIVNRGFIWIKPKQEYWDWASSISDEQIIVDTNNSEGSIYLIEEDFFDLEPIIKKHFSSILKTECSSFCSAEHFPEFTLELFENWFDLDVGSCVFDLLSSKLEKEK